MPRRFRFEARKHLQRVKKKKEGASVSELRVSFPHPTHLCAELAASVSELRVSFPRPTHLCAELACLRRHLEGKSLPAGWIELADSTTQGNLVFAKLAVNLPLLSANASMLVKVDEELKWSLSCHGVLVEIGQCCILAAVPPRLTSVQAVLDLLATLQEVAVCLGNPVNDFRQLVDDRGTEFMDSTGSRRVASVDAMSNSIRHVACELLIPVSDKCVRCQQCMKYRGSLRVQQSRFLSRSSDRTDPHSCTPYGVLSTEEMQSRMSKLHTELRRIVKQRDRVKARLSRVVEKNGITVDEEVSGDLKWIMESEGRKATEKEGCTHFQRVFWEQQVLAASKKDSRGMRWHPLMIKWCIYLRAQSQSAYETLAQSRCIKLPSQRTLRDYTHHLKPVPGYSAGVDAQLHSAAKLDKCEEREKCVLLLLDEMYVKQDLVYSKTTGELVGFVNLGDINMHLLAFERALSSSSDGESSNDHETLARTVMSLMVRGLFSRLEFPYVNFPCNNLTGELIYAPFWEAVHRLERLGFKVMGSTFDGSSVNRKFVRLHSRTRKLVNQILNPFSTDARQFFFFIDPPHLIKTTRNCWASNARTLWNNGHEIKWTHVWTLYYRSRSPTGLELLPKLKFEHIKLTSFSKMRVDLAAQVLSHSVSKCLTHTLGLVAEGSAQFAIMFDKFFDALNVCNFDEGKHERKPFKDPYRSSSDFRIKWLEKEFLPYLDKWEHSVKSREGFTDAEKKRMTLSQETLGGIRITTKSFVGLVRYLFKVPGVKYFLSRHICQDPLEKFFGCQRQMGGTHNNPTVKEVQQNTQAIRVVGSFCREIVKGNCRGNKRKIKDNVDEENCDLPLKKRCKSRAKNAREV